MFLIGPRLTGKSTYVSRQLDVDFALSWNLLSGKLRYAVETHPGLLQDEVELRNLKDCTIFIDEIQKCPSLLDDIHLLIEERNIRFLLTGSSLFKLRKGGVNLLGGRASLRYFHPLTYLEAVRYGENERLSLQDIFRTGMLPSLFLSEDVEEAMGGYIHTYLSEELAAEGAVRNLGSFNRFLQTAAIMSGQILNYQNVANDVMLSVQTVKNWFQILYDTLLGFEVPAFTNTQKRKAYSKSKFFIFDVGIVRFLRNMEVPSQTSSDFGVFFEHFIAMELRTWISYRSPRRKLRYWRSTSGFEVDFLIDEVLAIEVKATSRVNQKHLKGLKALSEENIFPRFILVCREEHPRKVGQIEILPWRFFLGQLYSGVYEL